MNATKNGGRIEEWSTDGEPGRVDAPWVVSTWPDGSGTERWSESAKRYRAGLPTTITRGRGGVIVEENYRLGGDLHRLDGPASIEYTDDEGVRTWSAHYVLGVTVDRGGIPGHLRSLEPHEARYAIEQSVYGDLIDEGVAPEQIIDALEEGVSSAEGIREVLTGAPVEWVRSFEGSRS